MARVDDNEPVNNYGRFALKSSSSRPDSRRRRGPSPEGRYDGRTHATRLPAAGLARTPVNTTLVGRLQDRAAKLEEEARDLRFFDLSPSVEEQQKNRRKVVELDNAAAEIRRRIDHMVREDTSVGAVDDPWDAGHRTYATIDRRVDILEQELSHKRISEAAYRTGRQVQAVLERQGRIGGADWAGASRGDPALANQIKILLTVMTAHEIVALEARIRGRIGERDLRLLRRVIGERMSFSDCAAFEGKSGERGTWYVAEKFRDALEQLADVFAGQGKGVPTPEDAYKEASADMDKRERVAIDRGVTRTRLAAELPDLRARAAATRSFRERCRLTAEADAVEMRLARLGGDKV